MQSFHLNPVLEANSKPSIFYFYSVLAKQQEALNFGQGFPNFPIPTLLSDNIDTVSQNVEEKQNFTFGTKKFLQTLSQEYSQFFKYPLEWDKHLIVGSGATQILMYIFQTVKPNEEVIILEPYFPWYILQSRLQQAQIKFVKYQQNEKQFYVDWNQVEKQCSQNTKYLLINSPHNPSGKILNEDDFKALQSIIEKFPQLTIISDEVYEMVYFTNESFPRIANYEKLWDNVISVYSGGKTYSCTGWRLGWAIGPESKINELKEIQRQTSNDSNGFLMDVMAEAMIQGRAEYKGYENYYQFLQKIFLDKKEKILKGLKNCSLNFKVIEPEGGHFVLCTIKESIKKMPISYFYEFDSQPFVKNQNNFLTQFEDWKKLENIQFKPDEAFCNFLTKAYKITPIPCNAFYFKSQETEKDSEIYQYLRFAICKKDEDIENLVKQLPQIINNIIRTSKSSNAGFINLAKLQINGITTPQYLEC